MYLSYKGSMRLRDRVAVVTGAGRGIGRAIALGFAGEGAQLVLAARSANELVAVAQQVQNLGRQALPQVADVTDESAVLQLVERAYAVFGRIDILVNNAGSMTRGSLEDTSPAVWRELLEVNLTGAYLCCRAVLPIMRAQGGGGQIINVAARAGREASPDATAFSASKFGLVGLTKSLAEEVRREGIRVNAICPGAVDTRLHAESGRPAAGELISPDSVARAAIYLASDEAGAVTGAAIDVYGAG
jgi:NAD(P)-dependent dehydrogenase (short-subunit alcohol dehydrogenase family)